MTEGPNDAVISATYHKLSASYPNGRTLVVTDPSDGEGVASVGVYDAEGRPIMEARDCADVATFAAVVDEAVQIAEAGG